MTAEAVRNAGGGTTYKIGDRADVCGMNLGGEPGIVVGVLDQFAGGARASVLLSVEDARDLRDALTASLGDLTLQDRCPAILEDHDARCERSARHDGQHRQSIPGTLHAWHVWGAQ